MKTLSKIAVATGAAVGLALAAAAFAHGPGYGYGPGGDGHHGYGYGHHGYGQGFGMMGRYGGGPGAGPCFDAATIDARLDAIKDELKLTAKQTPAWEAFENAVRTQAQTMTAGPRGSRDRDVHIAFMEQRLAGMKAVQKARTDLYNVLTPEQKVVADRYGFLDPRG